MNTETKTNVIKALEAYMDLHNLSQSDVAKKAGVNASYLIQMRKYIFSIKVGGKDVEIASKYFRRVADCVGFKTEKEYFPTRETDQLKEIIAELSDAKANGEVAVLIGETGCGKTFSFDLFKSRYPNEVFSVKVGSSDNLSDLIDKVMEALQIEAVKRTKSARLRQITTHLKGLAEKGFEPVLAFDEAEYMKQPALCSFKELFDYLNEWCSLVLIGVHQLVENIEKLRKRNKPGIPQLYRRIKFRIRILSPIDKRYEAFLKGIEPNLKKWIQRNCDNYGEVRDVLVPAMREAERTNSELNEEFVKMVLGIS